MEQKVIRLGFSSCPNDTFIFCAIEDKAVPGRFSFRFDTIIADVEELNRMAKEKDLDVTKVSVGSYSDIWEDYVVLTSGGALARGSGPIVVARKPMTLPELRDAVVAIPGAGTTANLLLDILDLHKGIRREMIFHEIIPAVKAGMVDAGVVIHEGRWIYEAYGLLKVADLGELWEKSKGLPLPLGIIVIRRTLALQGMAGEINACIKKSIDFARAYPGKVWPFIKIHAKEMEDDIIQKHIDAFVNNYTIDMGQYGKKAVSMFLEQVIIAKDIKKPSLPVFWDEL